MPAAREQRRLAAILAADVAGYSRAIADDESGTLAQVRDMLREVVGPAVAEHGGRVFKVMGDGLLAEFPSAVGAARAATAIQQALAVARSPLRLRIGLHLGDAVVEGDDLFGDSVIVATRLQAEAEPGGIVVSEAFRGQLERGAGLGFLDLGTRQLKNIADPIHVYRLGHPDRADARLRRTALRRLALTAPLILAVGVLVAWLASNLDFRLGRGSPTDGAAPSIAVLPFDNLSDDPEQAFFAEGLADDLIADLAKIEGVRVISRASSFAYGAESMPVAEIGSRLNARYIVDGSVRRAGDRLRITASLIDGDTDTALWADRFEGAGGDVFEFQDQITGRIIEELRVQLTPAEQQAVVSRGTDNPAAYDAYLRGMRLLSDQRRLDSEANAAARTNFEEAIRIDPDYALAYAGMAWADWLHYATINYYSLDRQRSSVELAKKSLGLRPNALAHRTLAKQYFANLAYDPIQHRPGLALEHLEAAARLEPNNPDVLADLADALAFVGRPDEALETIRKAIRLNPDHPDWYFFPSGVALMLTGDYPAAVRDFEAWAAAEPARWEPYLWLAAALALDGQIEKAKAALARHERLFFPAFLPAVRSRWPLQPEHSAIFLEGLRLAGAKEAPG